MLLLYETPAGYSIFKVNDIKKLKNTDADDIYDTFFASSEKALQNVSLVSFQPFRDTADAVKAVTACYEGTVTDELSKFLLSNKQHKSIFSNDNKKIAELMVADKNLGVQLKDTIANSTSNTNIKIVHDSTKTQELYRGIRTYLETYLTGSTGLSAGDIYKMQLGVSHSMSRYKLKFSADKVDTMIIQAIGLLDELDKEINIYAMRVKEWYGWHFPELQAICGDNMMYSTLVKHVGYRKHYSTYDNLRQYLNDDESLEATIQEAAEISMGTDITDLDLLNIRTLAENVLSMSEYRNQLYEYLRNRMTCIAPNLTILVGELVGARLISHAGSLMNLAKQPASTIQILGAEKALFRALKTKSNTPKYGLIYHASLIGQAPPKHKGKISRILAAKSALAIRVDALTEDDGGADDQVDGGTHTFEIDTTIGFDGRAKVEARLRQLETGGAYTLLSSSSNNNKGLLTAKKTARYDPVAATTNSSLQPKYNPSNDIQMELHKNGGGDDDDADDDDDKKKSKKDKKKEKKAKKDKKRKKDDDDDDDDDNTKTNGHEEDPITPVAKKSKLDETVVATPPAKTTNGGKGNDNDDDDDDDDDDDNDDDKGESKSDKKKKKKKEKKTKSAKKDKKRKSSD